jgi:hypothetical protein
MILLGVVRGEGGKMRKEVRWEERSLSPSSFILRTSEAVLGFRED